MKTNKFWSILMMLNLVLGTVIPFSSCSSDDDDENSSSSSIIGTWCGTDIESFTEDGISYEYNGYTEITFQKDGIVINYNKGTEKVDGKTEEYESTEYNSWKTDGNTLYLGPAWGNKDEVKPIDINDPDTWETKNIYSISGNKFTVTPLPPYGEGSYTLTRK